MAPTTRSILGTFSSANLSFISALFLNIEMISFMWLPPLVSLRPSRLHLHIFVVSSAYSSTSISCRRLDLLLNAPWYEVVYYSNLVFCQLFIILTPQVFGEAGESLPGEGQKIPSALLWSDG